MIDVSPLSPSPRVYLGDGLYAEFDGYQVTLTTPREDGLHFVCLEPSVLNALLDYLNCFGIIATPKEQN